MTMTRTDRTGPSLDDDARARRDEAQRPARRPVAVDSNRPGENR